MDTEQRGIHPIDFAHHFDDLIRRLDDVVRNIPQHRTPSFRVHQRTIAPGAFTTITEDIRPDRWLIVSDQQSNTSLGCYPSNGQPVFPSMFIISGNDSMTLPGLSQYLSVTNLGNQSSSIHVFALVGYDMEYDPPTNSGGVNVSTSGTFTAIAPSDTVPLAPLPRAVFVGSGGTIIARGINDTVDTSFLNLVSGSTLLISPQFIRATGTTAANLIGLY